MSIEHTQEAVVAAFLEVRTSTGKGRLNLTRDGVTILIHGMIASPDSIILFGPDEQNIMLEDTDILEKPGV